MSERPATTSRPVLVQPAPTSAHPADAPAVVTPAGETGAPGRSAIVGDIGAPDHDGRRPVEVVVDGWRFELLVEDAERAELRRRASRDRGQGAAGGGVLEIRAVIPGRIASVAVNPGDAIEAGRTLLSVEAMKMQNELRAPRAGTVAQIPASPGSTVEVGDVLVVLE